MANIFEFLPKDGNITPEKACKSRQMQFHDKTSFAIDEPGSSVRALYATLFGSVPFTYCFVRKKYSNI